MVSIAVIGDGPGGLSAALFLAKGGHEAVVYGDDNSGVNSALAEELSRHRGSARIG